MKYKEPQVLHNLSSWQAIAIDNWQQNQKKCLTIVTKQSFEYDDNGNVYPMQTSEKIIMADEMFADPTTSSLQTVNETVAFKNGFELYGNLTAYPPKAKQAKVIEVNITLKQNKNNIFSKTLRATGERIWQGSLLGTKASDPKTLKPTPLTYENTYGGIDPENPQKTFEENPAGKGFRIKQTKGSLLPSIEYPNKCLKHPKKQIPPASYGAIPQFWQPRLSLLPEVDQEALMLGEYPYQNNINSAAFNAAPQDQQLNITFNNDITLHLKGVSPNKDYQHIIKVALPHCPPLVTLINGEEQTFIDLTCDTLIIDSDANAFHLVWRKSIDINKINAYSQILIQQEKQQKTENKKENEVL